jgi:acyl-CoA reductase-like NAD-dependent aldehyde dehydrogenase
MARKDNGDGALGADAIAIRKAYKMYVGGAFVRSESGRYWQVPEDARLGGESAKENIPLASRKDGRDAVTAARAAFEGWAARTGYNRGQILYRLGEMLDARQAELARSLERGR